MKSTTNPDWRWRILLIAIVLFGMRSAAQQTSEPNAIAAADPGTHQLSNAEKELARQLNLYRKSRNLPAIPLSASLSIVARAHVMDLSEHYEYGGRCNLHSWSESAQWSSCCYTNDHSKASCMWDKPRELTVYSGDGYEIAFFSNYEYESDAAFAKDVLEGWKSSRGHHELIINKGKWTTSRWQAMGVGVFGDFAVVWFGEEIDPAGSPVSGDN
ncbi:MAG: hypothetical protein JNL22_13790 [Bacteroidales bacterium]|jgi:uncharacterized protein YkwD|nr:hypothetical protein [Bacteroidales bacterium]